MHFSRAFCVGFLCVGFYGCLSVQSSVVKKSAPLSVSQIATPTSQAKAPVATAVDPPVSTTAGGSSIAISGVNFQSGAAVYIDGVSCTSPSISATHIACTTPTHALGIVSVVITNPDGQSSTLANSFTYETQTGTWSSTTSTTGAPTARVGFSSVWTGTKFIIWGGTDGVLVFNTGAIYDPVANTWTTMTTTGAPTGRTGHSAIWTGSKMVVWGGYNVAATNDGGIYDPVADSWTSVTTTGAPSVRRFHSAVWTGSKMLIWGGSNIYYSVLYNDGASYDPVANTWSAITSTGQPDLRLYPSAVWSGSKMVIWGGTYNGNFLNTGYIYDPTGNSWTALSTTNAPSGRFKHSVVSTGTKMIVWGGYGSGGYLNTGGIYDYAGGTWSSMATPTISGRTDHSAVWTGSAMLIWGGGNDKGFQSTGSNYSLAGDSWTSLAIASAPTARSGQASTWTGTQMIIWGGKDSTGTVITGALHTP